uniref:Uncharacterized protein n=1 Tax=Anguilla anguilla TaxID=7936 RepID=A0A0E9R494_ANGAN
MIFIQYITIITMFFFATIHYILIVYDGNRC